MTHRKMETLEDLLKQPIIKCILAGLIPAVLLLFIYMRYGVYPYEKITVMHSDLNGQYVSYLVNLKKLLENGGSFLYSFSKTLGGDFMPILTYYLMSPFNIVLLFFPPERISYAVFLIVVLKTAACGITMFLYLSERNSYRYYALLFSTAYALSGYMIMFQTHIMWLDGVILLPVIALGIDRLIARKKSAVYIFSLAGSIAICYYTGFMSCVFAVLFFGYRLILVEKKENRIGSIFKFSVASVCAGGISAVVLFPAIYALFSTKLANKAEIPTEGMLLYPPFDLLSKFFTGAGNNTEFHTGIPFVFCGILTFLLLITSFTLGKIKIKEKILNGLLLIFFSISFCIRPLDNVWHGFAMPNNFNHRYSFIFIFFVILIAWNAFSTIVEKRTFSKKSVLLTGIIVLLAEIFVLFKQYTYLNSFVILSDIIIMTAGLLLLFFAIRTEQDWMQLCFSVFGVLFLFNLYLNGIVVLRDRPYVDTSIQGYVTEVEDSIAYIERYDSGYYRIEQDFHYSHNDAMLFSYRGLSHFSSAETQSVIQFMGRMGYNQYYNYWAKYGKGATLAADSLLGMKYFLSRKEQKYFEEFHRDATVYTYYNPYALEFGVVASSETLHPIDWQEDVFENQNRMYSALLGKKIEFLVPIPFETETAGLRYVEHEKVWIKTVPDKNVHIKYRFMAENENPIYLYLPSNGAGSAIVLVNDEPITNWLDTENSGILPLGTFLPGQTVDITLVPEDNSIGMTFVSLVYLDLECFKEHIGQLKQKCWYLYESTDTHLEAEVTATENEVLFLSIPYDKNWTLYVDGEKTEYKEVFDVFMAVELLPGTHHIVLEYRNLALILGLFVTILCTFIGIFIIILENKKKKIRNTEGKLLHVA